MIAGLIAAALLVSLGYEHPEDPVCERMLGAGFPVIFICDNWGGGSPTSSWGKIDYVDVLNGGIKPVGLALDIAFFSLPIGILSLLAGSLISESASRHKLRILALFMAFAYVAGFLFAWLVFQPGLFPIQNPLPLTPVPTFFTPTPIGTPPPGPTAAPTLPPYPP
ncbi:MAG TPA: hypothetical protein VIV15_03220 [Anaerolineales bacterium]